MGTNTFYTSIRKLFLILFISLIPSCMCTRSSVVDGTGDTQPPEKAKKKSTVIVLLHGLNDVNHGQSGLEQLKTQLVTDLVDKKDVTVIAPVRINSFTDSLDKQLADLYADLQQNHKDSEFIIYGHSQGGVLAASLWCKHKGELKIKCLVLDRAPLAGFDPLSAANEHKTKDLKNCIGWMLASLPFASGFNIYLDNLNNQGIQDLAPKSMVIQDILAKLPNIDIPVLLISCESTFLTNFQTKADTHTDGSFSSFLISFCGITSLNALFSATNDGLISCQSQRLNDLGTGNANIKTESYVFTDYMGFVHGFLITQNKMQTAYSKLLAQIKSCITS